MMQLLRLSHVQPMHGNLALYGHNEKVIQKSLALAVHQPPKGAPRFPTSAAHTTHTCTGMARRPPQMPHE